MTNNDKISREEYTKDIRNVNEKLDLMKENFNDKMDGMKEFFNEKFNGFQKIVVKESNYMKTIFDEKIDQQDNDIARIQKCQVELADKMDEYDKKEIKEKAYLAALGAVFTFLGFMAGWFLKLWPFFKEGK